MPDLTPLYTLLAHLCPLDCMQSRFMQQALLALLLLAPMTAAMGILVVNFRMAFFAEAISHSAFTGVALGMLLTVSPELTMPLFGLAVGLGIVAAQHHSSLASDTVIGVFFSGMVAFGLAMVSRDRSLARDMQRFLYGDILTISETEIWVLLLLACVVLVFLALSYNRLLYAGLDETLARTHRVSVLPLQYVFCGILALLVMFAVQAIGVFLVTALLVVPAATARNLSGSAGGMFWWAVVVSEISAGTGLIISAQDWAQTATGATIILIACGFFAASLLVIRLKN